MASYTVQVPDKGWIPESAVAMLIVQSSIRNDVTLKRPGDTGLVHQTCSPTSRSCPATDSLKHGLKLDFLSPRTPKGPGLSVKYVATYFAAEKGIRNIHTYIQLGKRFSLPQPLKCNA